MLVSRPQPAVTRLNNTRVLDRVAGNNASLRSTTAATRATDAPQAQEAPPIPSFLKLVKC